jgi:type I restriction enzyme, R subunit
MKPEQQTRQHKIDLQLGRAGWALGSRQLIQEFLVSNNSSLKEPATPYRTKNEFADYALLDRLGRPLAIVEAKRPERDPLEAERQVADYADAILAKEGIDPFIFLAKATKSGSGTANRDQLGRSVDFLPKTTSPASPI